MDALYSFKTCIRKNYKFRDDYWTVKKRKGVWKNITLSGKIRTQDFENV